MAQTDIDTRAAIKLALDAASTPKCEPSSDLATEIILKVTLAGCGEVRRLARQHPRAKHIAFDKEGSLLLPSGDKIPLRSERKGGEKESESGAIARLIEETNQIN